MSSWYTRIERRLAVVRLMWSSGDALLAARVFCFAVSAPLLARLPLTRVERLLEPRRTPRGAHAAPAAQVRHISEVVLAVLSAGRPLVRKGCLVRGLTLYYFLRRADAGIHLSFGLGSAATDDDVFGDGFDGHCWLVKDGEPFLETRDPRPLYTEMYAFPSAPRSLAPSSLRLGEELFRS